MVCKLTVFSSSKCSLFHNSIVFGSCIIRILFIYSTNIGTEYFKHGIYSPFFPLKNAVCFIILTYLVPVLFTLYILGVLKLKKYNSGAKRLNSLGEATPLPDWYRQNQGMCSSSDTALVRFPVSHSRRTHVALLWLHCTGLLSSPFVNLSYCSIHVRTFFASLFASTVSRPAFTLALQVTANYGTGTGTSFSLL